jgi:hypothetical protein
MVRPYTNRSIRMPDYYPSEDEQRRQDRRAARRQRKKAKRQAREVAKVKLATKNNKKRTLVPGDGPPCPRCGEPSQIREHPEVTPKMLAQAYYYSRWFCCIQRDCRTNLFYDERYRVYPHQAAAPVEVVEIDPDPDFRDTPEGRDAAAKAHTAHLTAVEQRR